MNKDKILLILTGGTICSFQNKDGEKKSDAEKAERLIKSIFKKNNPKFKADLFDEIIAMDILSENMTPDRWNELVDKLNNSDMESYKGVIILHGTDTLAYTASMLSIVFAGLSVPIFLVSSQLPLSEKDANGNDNFKVAVNLIMDHIEPNIYVPYRNMDGKMLVHLGSHILQCPNLSDDFSSKDPWMIEDMNKLELKGLKSESDAKLYKKIGDFKSSVIKIEPYVGLNYEYYNFEKAEAIIHGTYHSQTLCVAENKFSALKFRELKLPVFIEPCNYEPDRNISCYETTAMAVKDGLIPVWGMTSEMVYVKAMVGIALGYRNESLTEFLLNEHINYEFHY